MTVTPGEILGKDSDFMAGKGAYVSPHNRTIYASLSGRRNIIPPSSLSSDKVSNRPPTHLYSIPQLGFLGFLALTRLLLLCYLQRPTVEVVGHKPHGPVPEPGSVVIARVTKVMARTAAADIMCVGPKSVREKFTGIIRQQDVRATEIDKVDMHLSFRPGDIVRAVVLSLGDARAYHLSTAKNELGVVSAESIAGGTMVPISWTEMQCPLTGQIEQRKVAKVECHLCRMKALGAPPVKFSASFESVKFISKVLWHDAWDRRIHSVPWKDDDTQQTLSSFADKPNFMTFCVELRCSLYVGVFDSLAHVSTRIASDGTRLVS
ncbi:hypothetical protein ACLOJK_011195 [Asimina triloba]